MGDGHTHTNPHIMQKVNQNLQQETENLMNNLARRRITRILVNLI